MPGPAPETQRRTKLLRGTAVLCTLLVLAVTSLSAFLRLDKAGLGCVDRPACYGAALRATQSVGAVQAAPALAASPASGAPRAVAAARIAHRFAAVAVLALIVAMLVLALGSAPPLRTEAVLAAALLVLAIGLAVLGRFSAEARVPAVTLGNLLGGLAMLAVSARLTVAAPRRDAGLPGRDDHAGASARDDRVGTAARWLLTLVVVQAAVGGLASATYSGLSCTSLADCWRGAAAVDAATLDPWREPVVSAGGGAAEPGALIQLLHRAGAAVVALGAVVLAIVAWRRARRATAIAIAGLVAIEAGLGLAMVAAALPLLPALLHNVVAALLVVLLARSA